MEKIVPLDEFEKKNKNLVFKAGEKQVLLIEVDGQVFALDNRCPHEGYPLSVGSVEQKSCVLTCNWHNWKFDLKTGTCLLGSDNVRTYPVTLTESEIKIALQDPPPEVLEQKILDDLKVGFEKNDYGRMARELSRLCLHGIDPLVAIKKAILWSHDRLEFGTTHAYAALADWLSFYQKSETLEDRLICLTEGIAHMAFDSLRHERYPYGADTVIFSEQALSESIEREERHRAESLVHSFFAEGGEFSELEEVLSTLALEHYNDFGHSLIYVVKSFEVSRLLKEPEVDRALALSLVRSLCYSTREDLIPEFKNYRSTLESTETSKLNEGTIGEAVSGGVNKAFEWFSKTYPRVSNADLYDHLLFKNAENFLLFDLKLQEATNNPVSKNIGWLDFTHGITFANAVCVTCQKFPKLWPAGLLQMVCFYGRNNSFLDKGVRFEDWAVRDEQAFQEKIERVILDHGLALPIFSSHIIKTAFATFEEAESASSETQAMLYASLNRFVNSPLKQKHARRIVSQGIKLVFQK